VALFNRVASLTVGKAGAVGLQFSGFRILFDISKTSSTEPNTANIQVFGLSSDTRSKVSEEDQIIEIKAGYVEDSGEEILYIGDVNRVGNSFPRPDVVTNFECGDGEKFLNNTKISTSFKPGASVKQIIKDITKKASIALKTNLNLINIKTFTFNNGFSFTGMYKKLLDKLTDTGDLSWSVQNNELKFYPKSDSDSSTAIVINSTSGLIGSPEKIKIKEGKKTSKKEIDGWKVKSLLQPKAEPGGSILLSSRDVGNNKQFKIYSVSHSGDTDNGEFKTIMEVIEK